jgi:hypothetical protein
VDFEFDLSVRDESQEKKLFEGPLSFVAHEHRPKSDEKVEVDMMPL